MTGRSTLSEDGAGEELGIDAFIDGRYRLLKILGAGGVGVVYEARHLRLGHSVALKVLRRDGEVVRARFEREARLLSELNHPHIVGLTDYGVHEGAPFLVMERLEGETLEARLDDDLLDPREALEIFESVVKGLSYAHAKNVLHRDLKPGNIFLQSIGDEEHVKLVDFGLAKLVADDEDDEAYEPTLTRAGTILGTPAYMAPEQASGTKASAPSDVYSAGIVLFEMLAGRPPFAAERRAELLRQHLLEEVPDPSLFRGNLRLTSALRELLRRCLAKNASERFANAGELLEALHGLPTPAAQLDESRATDNTRAIKRRTLASHRPVARKDRPYFRWAAIAAAMLGTILWVWLRPTPGTPPEKAPAPPPPAFAPVEAAAPVEEHNELEQLLRDLNRGEGVNRAAHRALRQYQRQHPRDPRPSLALARDLAAKNAWAPALERYTLVEDRFPGSLDDVALQHLLDAFERDVEGADGLILRAFRDQAFEPVRERRAQTEVRELRRRYRRLLERLSAEPAD
ncbi:MAG: serine/threonine-protein kinase [Myxococcota bacterium]